MTKRNSRELALKILFQINEEGAYANLALDKALFPLKDLDSRDRGLITEIVYGSVKNRGKLDYVLNLSISFLSISSCLEKSITKLSSFRMVASI